VPRTIAAWTKPDLAPAGRVAPFVNFSRSDDGEMVAVTSRDAAGAMVTIAVPAAAWRTLKDQIFRETAAP